MPVLREGVYNSHVFGVHLKDLCCSRIRSASIENEAMHRFMRRGRVDHASLAISEHRTPLVNYFQLLLIVIRNKRNTILRGHVFSVLVS